MTNRYPPRYGSPWTKRGKLNQILANQEWIMSQIDDLKASVQRNRDAEQSVVTLLQGISQQLKDAQASNDPAAIQQVISDIDANTQAMADAVTANTQASAPPQNPPQ